MKWVSLLLVAVLCVVAVTVVSCSKPAEEEQEVGVAPPRPTPPPPAESEEESEVATEPGDAMDVVKVVGVELPEGATEQSCEPSEDGVKATFEVDMPYEDAKAYFTEKCADWEGSGLEGEATTGNEWEFKSPDGKVTIKLTSESAEAPTTIEYSVQCEPGEFEDLLAATESATESAAESAAEPVEAEAGVSLEVETTD